MAAGCSRPRNGPCPSKMASRSEVGAIAGMDSDFGSIPERGRKDSILCVRLFLFTSSFHDIIAITCTQSSYTFLMIFHSLVGHRQYWQEDCSCEYGTLTKYWDTAGKHHLVAA